MGDFYFNSKRGITVKKQARVDSEKPVKQTTEYTSISPEVSEPDVIARNGDFVKYVTDLVYDKNTGLEWFVGPDRKTSWNQAKAWVESLNVDGGGWRMPTIEELKTLYKEGESKWYNMTPLLKTTGWWVWSGETKDWKRSWGFHFNLGRKYPEYRSGSRNARGFAVRFQR